MKRLDSKVKRRDVRVIACVWGDQLPKDTDLLRELGRKQRRRISHLNQQGFRQGTQYYSIENNFGVLYERYREKVLI